MPSEPKTSNQSDLSIHNGAGAGEKTKSGVDIRSGDGANYMRRKQSRTPNTSPNGNDRSKSAPGFLNGSEDKESEVNMKIGIMGLLESCSNLIGCLCH